MSVSSVQSANQSGKLKLKWAVLLVGLVGLVLAFVFFAFFAEQFSEAKLELDIGGNKVSIATAEIKSPVSEIEEIDLERYYVDSLRGFSFERPDSGSWSDPEHIEGFDAFIDAKSLTVPPEVREQMASLIRFHPLGRMMQRMLVVRLTSGAPILVEITDETSNETLDLMIEVIREEAAKKGENIDDEFIKRVRRNALGFESFNFSNEFTVTILEKRYAKGAPIKLTLPGLFLAIVGQFGLSVDKLVADESTILAGATFDLERVKIDGRLKDLRVDRWMLMMERAEQYYLIEVAYSPQTSDSVEVWNQLRDMMNTFRVHEG